MKIDQIIRSSRKTVAIIVRRDGKVIVRAPHRLPEKAILRFVSRKSSWISARLAEVQQRNAQVAPKQFVEGETFLYLGESYPLALSDGTRPVLDLNNGAFTLYDQALPKAKQAFIAWYREQARLVFTQRVNYYADCHHLAYSKIHISSARTLWGSCSARDGLSFTWRLVMAPLPVIDYVVVHELSHLVEKNHSRRFWAQVETILPDYKERLDWLKKNGHRLTIE